MKKIILLYMLLITIPVYSNDATSVGQMKKDLEKIQKQNSYLLKETYALKKDLSSMTIRLNSLEKDNNEIKFNIVETSNNLNVQLSSTKSTIEDSKQALDNSIATKTTIGIICIVFIVGTFLLICFLLWRRQNSEFVTLDNIRETQNKMQSIQKKIQEESLKLDNQLLDILDKEKISQESSRSGAELDQSLVMKVADEIARMETNMSRMDSSIRGYKQLANSIKHIKDNYLANDYEIVEMLGKPYDEGMKVIADFVQDDNIEEGKQIITGIIKPQINYKGKMIQSAQIKVSQNI